jgi:acetoacetyl-CoA synthetase
MQTDEQLSPFVEIRVGEQHPPIVIAHGLSGVVQFSELARHIRTRHPIYGIQARGVDGREDPLKSVPEMAGYYLRELSAIQPRGPYLLIGYSFGGLVALEMAQRLSARGEQIALLALLDAFPHPRFMPLPWRLRLFVRRMVLHARKIRTLSSRQSFSYFMSGVKRRLHLSRPLHDVEIAEATGEQVALCKVNRDAYSAYSSYRPEYYPQKITFVATEDKTFFPGDPRAIWSRLAAEMEVDVIPGTHLNIVTTEFQALAEVLTRHLQRATE